MILRFFQFKIHYFWVFLVLFNYILPRYKEGNGVLISGEKRRPLFMLSHTAQKGDFGASNIRKTIVFEVPLFFLRIASAHFYEDVVLLCFLPICFLMLSFFSFPFEKKFSHLIFDCSSISCRVSEISINSKGSKPHFLALGQ